MYKHTSSLWLLSYRVVGVENGGGGGVHNWITRLDVHVQMYKSSLFELQSCRSGKGEGGGRYNWITRLDVLVQIKLIWARVVGVEKRGEGGGGGTTGLYIKALWLLYHIFYMEEIMKLIFIFFLNFFKKK